MELEGPNNLDHYATGEWIEQAVSAPSALPALSPRAASRAARHGGARGSFRVYRRGLRDVCATAKVEVILAFEAPEDPAAYLFPGRPCLRISFEVGNAPIQLGL